MRRSLLLLGACAFLVGCHQHPLTDYRPLDHAGMNSGTVEQLKKLNTSDTEVLQLVKLKNSGVTDDTCVALLTRARQHQLVFSSADSTISLARAGFTEAQILDIAANNQLDTISGEAITLRLIGLSDSTVQWLLQRHMQGQPTLSSGQISRLKNTGLTERQILDRINAGMTEDAADKEIIQREAQRNHANTGFTRVRGRKPR
jgi:hypothetical protein